MRRWFAKFRSGDFGLEDEKGRERKPSIENDQLKTLVDSNPQTTVRDISEELKVSIWTISTHLKAIGKVKNLNKWVSHLLNETQKEKRYEVCSMLLNRNESNLFLIRTITCEEKWMLYYNRKRSAD